VPDFSRGRRCRCSLREVLLRCARAVKEAWSMLGTSGRRVSGIIQRLDPAATAGTTFRNKRYRQRCCRGRDGLIVAPQSLQPLVRRLVKRQEGSESARRTEGG